MIQRTMTAGLVLALCATTVTAQAEDTTYPIKITRAMSPGQSFDYGGEGMVDQTVGGSIMGGAAETNQTRIIVRLKSEMTVNEADEHGRPTMTTHIVKSCEVLENGETIYELEPGATMTAMVNGHMTDIDVDGEAAPAPMLDALRLVVSLEGEGATEDAMYGSESPRQTGESWPINVGLLHEYFQAQTAQPMTKEQIRGTSTLDSVFEFEGQSCMKVVTEMATDGAVPGLGDLPPGATLEEASMKAKFESLMPETPESVWIARSVMMDMHVIMNQPGLGKLNSKTKIVVNMNMSPKPDAMATVDEEVLSVPE